MVMFTGSVSPGRGRAVGAGAGRPGPPVGGRHGDVHRLGLAGQDAVDRVRVGAPGPVHRRRQDDVGALDLEGAVVDQVDAHVDLFAGADLLVAVGDDRLQGRLPPGDQLEALLVAGDRVDLLAGGGVAAVL